MLVLPGILFSGMCLLSLFNEKHLQSAILLWTYRSFLWEMYQIRKNVPNLNQTFLMMTKILKKTPYTLNESCWDTYADVKNQKDLKPVWPYLWRIDNTTLKKPTLSSADGTNSQPCLNFSSYSYVHAIKEESIREYVFDEMRKGNYAFGAHGPRMLNGSNAWLCKLEESLAKYTGREACLTYSSGFLACKTVIQAIGGKNDVIFGDSRLHESLRDGIRCAKQKGCASFTFKHNDLEHLDQLLRKHRLMAKNAFIITEEIFSMDGDYPDLCELKRIADKYDAKIILDAAHSLGIMGKTGRGLEEIYNCQNAAWLIVGSFTKALGSVGGFCCGPAKIIDFLHFFSTGTMFSAPMSVGNAIAAYATLQKIIEHPEWLEETHQNISRLKSALKPLEQKYSVSVQTSPHSPLICLLYTSPSPRD